MGLELHWLVQWYQKQRGKKALDEQEEELSKEEVGILDLLARGLSREFPNPQRVGCPDLQCSEASLSASCGSQMSSNGWITLAPAVLPGIH